MIFPGPMRPDAICDNCPHAARALCRAVTGATDQAGHGLVSRRRDFAAETTLRREGEAPAVAGILKRGYLRTERILQDGRRSVLGFLAPGDLIGDVTGTEVGPALVAATRAEVCSIDPAALRRAMRQDPALKAHVLAEAMKQHTRQLEMVWRRGALNSRERIIAFMVMAAEFMPTERLADGSTILTIGVSRRDWADFSNTTVETICRTLGHLARNRLVRTVSQGRYQIGDMERLAQLAGIDERADRSAMLLGETPGKLWSIKAGLGGGPGAARARQGLRGARPAVGVRLHGRHPAASASPPD